MITQSNPFTAFQLVMLDDAGPPATKIMGWLRLLDGDDDAGYVYLSFNPVKTRLSGQTFGRPYVVMSRQPSELSALLAFLNDGRQKRVRYAGQTEEGGTAFLEHDIALALADDEAGFQTLGLKLPR